MTKTVAAGMLLFAFQVANAADYPTAPNEMDKLCEVIGEAPNLSIPPKDRLWFKENCNCIPITGCGRFGSERFGQRVDATKASLAARRERQQAATAEKEATAAAKRATRAAQRPLRLAYWKCVDAIIPGVTPAPPAGQRACERETVALEKACGRGTPWSTCILLDKSEAESLEGVRAKALADATAAQEAQRRADKKRLEEEQQARDARLKQAAEPLRAAFFGCMKRPNRGPGACGAEAVALTDTCLKLSTSALQNQCLSE